MLFLSFDKPTAKMTIMTRKNIVFHSLIIACLFTGISCENKSSLTESSATPADTLSFVTTEAPRHFFNKPEEYLDWQAKQILSLTGSAMLKYPPRIDEPLERQMAMLMLDAVFHDEKAPHRESVQDFHHRRTLFALEQIKNGEVKSGVKIWKLYNMGVIARTQTVTVAFDITRGYSSKSDSFALSNEIMEKIINHCDVLFISHRHRDHADEEVAKMFIEQGKPVVAPPDIWEDKDIYSAITHLDRKAHEIQSLPLNNIDLNLEVVIYPGHQGTDIPNNVVLVITPEKYSICHTGDQSSDDDWNWIDEVKNHFKVDILLPNCWTSNPLRTSKGYNPQLIIPVHENELGHTIDHREAYALNYSRWNVPYDKIIMSWGESFHYNP
jgi:L-ascorbate metabolism protein UlaG (beta-lactamase superfamily)